MKPKHTSPSAQTGDINNRDGKVIIAGRDANLTETNITTTNTTTHYTFSDVYQKIDAHKKFSQKKKEDLKADVAEVEAAVKAPKVDEDFVVRRLRNIGRMAPDILKVALAAIANPAAGLAVVAERIAAKAMEK